MSTTTAPSGTTTEASLAFPPTQAVFDLTDEEREDYQCSVDTLATILATSGSMADLFTRLGTLDLVRFRKQRER
jgi:hypothetical protein